MTGFCAVDSAYRFASLFPIPEISVAALLPWAWSMSGETPCEEFASSAA